MKTELSKIAQDLEQGRIDETEAQDLLLVLLGVSKRFSLDDAISDIIDLTSSTEDDGSVWGFDTEIDSKQNLIKRAKEILLNV